MSAPESGKVCRHCEAEIDGTECPSSRSGEHAPMRPYPLECHNSHGDSRIRIPHYHAPEYQP